jgi:cytochrome c oxidase cbb3-type subunit 2
MQSAPRNTTLSKQILASTPACRAADFYGNSAMIFSSQHRNLMMVIAVLGVWWAASSSTSAQAPPAQPSPMSVANRGKDLYISQCSACHQVNGEGLPDVFPPLKGSGVVNKDDAAKHIHVVLYGMQGGRAGGVVYAAVMPQFAGMLSDADIADVIDYERSSWGNHGKPVAAAQVAAERSRSQ